MRYSENCIRQLGPILADHPDLFDTDFDTLSDFKSIRELCAHMIGAERRWVARLLGEASPARYEDSAPLTVAEIMADWTAVRAKTLQFVSAVDEAGSKRSIPIVIPAGEFDLTVDEIVFHIVNHQTYHLGQVIMTLQKNHVDPPNFDFVLLK
ncbi:MAG: DinB family protein [Capsulimonadaceae bacterium]